jgi:lipoprotein-anchoring transpeptidase ErfK/SrfK
LRRRVTQGDTIAGVGIQQGLEKLASPSVSSGQSSDDRIAVKLADDSGELDVMGHGAGAVVCHRWGWWFALCLLPVLFLVGCGGGGGRLRSEESHHVAYAAGLGVTRPAVSPVVRRCAAPGWRSSSSLSYAAVVRRLAVVSARPSGGRLIGRFRRLDQNGYPTTFAVVGARARGCRLAWYRVQVAVAPNGSTGWVRASAVRTYAVRSLIVVDLTRRRLSVYRSGRLTLRVPVAVGASQTPTPTGRFFVNERFVLSNPQGPFGVAALGISAHSTVLHDWVQGGPIALHGTNDPASIGQAASHGCIRLSNANMNRLLPLAPAGTPVVIRP